MAEPAAISTAPATAAAPEIAPSGLKARLAAIITAMGPFWRGVFSDDGQPSSSRVFTAILVIVTCGILCGVFRHICRLTDPAQLNAWLGAMPTVIVSLTTLVISVYGVNRASGSVSDILSAIKGKRE